MRVRSSRLHLLNFLAKLGRIPRSSSNAPSSSIIASRANTAGSGSSSFASFALILQPRDIEVLSALRDPLARESAKAPVLPRILPLRQDSGGLPSGSLPNAFSNSAKCSRVSGVRLPNGGMFARRS